MWDCKIGIVSEMGMEMIHDSLLNIEYNLIFLKRIKKKLHFLKNFLKENKSIKRICS